MLSAGPPRRAVIRWLALVCGSALLIAVASPAEAASPEDGTAFGWGRNANGTIGDGSFTNRSEPTEASMPSGVTFSSLSASYWHACSIGSDGNGYCWGNNSVAGQLGDGSYTNRNAPKRVSMPSGVSFTAISAGFAHTCALGSNDKAYCWGWNIYGQLGNGTTTLRNTPQEVTMPAGVSFTAISAGYGHTCALGSDSKTYCWGYNASGQVGDGSTTNRTTPTEVTLPMGVAFASISGGHGHTCAMGSNGSAYCWGSNSSGQLADGTTTARSVPTPVTLPSGVSLQTVSAGLNVTCGLDDAGAGYCAGNNYVGAVGDGSSTNRKSLVAVTMPEGVTFAQIDPGYEHTCALGSDANAYCWGSNEYSELGDGTTTLRRTPTLVSAPDGIYFAAVAPGRDVTTALTGAVPLPSESSSTASSIGAVPYRFHFLTSEGGPCLSSVTVVRGQSFALPTADVACTPEGSSLVGWSIPGQAANFSPGGVVRVWDNQTFTAVARYPHIDVTYDANVGSETACFSDGVDVGANERSVTIATKREGVLASQPPCAPSGVTFLGWTDRPTVEGPSKAVERALSLTGQHSVPYSWSRNPDPLNEVRLYAMWR